jgi:ribosomal protein S18 acetylase RimI-like enzyme
MSNLIEYFSGCAEETQIARHLIRCNEVFVPRLSTRVEISDYAHKIFCNAQLFEAWTSNELVGLVAVYCNAPDNSMAFITTVSVLPSWQGQGIAKRLLESCIAHVRKLGFTRIELEVDASNRIATTLYVKHGFSTNRQNSTLLTMVLNLK